MNSIFIKLLFGCAIFCFSSPACLVSATQVPLAPVNPGDSSQQESFHQVEQDQNEKDPHKTLEQASSVEIQFSPLPSEKDLLTENNDVPKILDIKETTNNDVPPIPLGKGDDDSDFSEQTNNKDGGNILVDVGNIAHASGIKDTPAQAKNTAGGVDDGLTDHSRLDTDTDAWVHPSLQEDPLANLEKHLPSEGIHQQLNNGGGGGGGEGNIASGIHNSVSTPEGVITHDPTTNRSLDATTPNSSPTSSVKETVPVVPVDSTVTPDANAYADATGTTTSDGGNPARGEGSNQRQISGDNGESGLDPDANTIVASQASTPVKMDSSSLDVTLDKASAGGATKLLKGMGGMAIDVTTLSGQERTSILSPTNQGQGHYSARSTEVDAQRAGTDGRAGKVAGNSEGGEEDLPTFDKWSVQYLEEQKRQKVEKEIEQVVDPAIIGQKLKVLRLNFASRLCGAKILANNPEAENTDKLLNSNPDEYMISPCKAKKWFVLELCEPLQVHRVEMGTVELFSSPPKSFKVYTSQRYPAKEWSPLGVFEMTSKRSIQSFQTPVSTDEYIKYIRVEMLEHHGEEHYCPITAFRVLGLDMASDDDEESDGGDGIYSNDEQDGQMTEEEEEVSGSLFDKTKKTVVELFQKVLYTGEEDDHGQQQKEKQASIVTSGDNDQQLQNKAGHESLGHPRENVTTTTSTGPGAPNQEDTRVGQVATPASPGTMPAVVSPPSVPPLGRQETGGEAPTADFPPPGRVKDPKAGVGDGDGVASDLFRDTGKVVQGGCMEITKPVEPEEIPIVTKLNDTEQLPTEDLEAPVVVKVEVGDGDELPPSSGSKMGDRSRGTSWRFLDRLVYFSFLIQPVYLCSLEGKESIRMLSRLSDKSTKLSTPVTSEAKGQATSRGREQTALNSDVDNGSNILSSSHHRTRQTVPSTTTVPAPVKDGQDLPATDSKKPKLTIPGSKPVVDTTNHQAEGRRKQEQELEQAASSQTTQFMSEDSSTPTIEVLEPSSLTVGAGLDSKAASVVTPVLDIEQSRVKVNEMGSADVTETVFLKVSPSPTTSSIQVADNTVLPETTATLPKAPASQHKPGDPASTSHKANNGDGSSSSNNGTKSVPSPGASATGVNVNGRHARMGRQVDLVKVPLSSASKRDASIIKLNNRIVALEQNVSMAKRYLEELSKAFKQQNEDMMSLVNKTVNKFNSHMAWAEERNLHHQTEIDHLDQRLSNLTAVVASLWGHVDSIGQELHYRQLILSLLQGLLFLWMTISSLRGRHKQSITITDHKFLLDTMPSQPNVVLDTDGVDSGGRGVVRRNSDSATGGLLVDASPLKRQTSETYIALSSSSPVVTAPGINDIFHGGLERVASQSSKKKKKKKMKALQQPKDADLSCISFKPSPVVVTSTEARSSIITSSSKSPGQTASFSSQAGVLFGAHCVPSSSFSDKTAPKAMVTAAIYDDAHSSPFITQSNHTLKENLSLLSLGIIPKAGSVVTDLISPDKGGLLSSSNCCSSTNTTEAAWGREKSKSLTPPLGGLDNVPISEQCHLLHHQSASPEKENGAANVRMSPSCSSSHHSPEFKLPSYHRNKLRKLGKFLDSGTQALSIVRKGKGVQKQVTKDSPTRKPIASNKSTNILDEEVLLAENRFQLPFSPSKLNFSNSNSNVLNMNSSGGGGQLVPALSHINGSLTMYPHHFHPHHLPSSGIPSLGHFSSSSSICDSSNARLSTTLSLSPSTTQHHQLPNPSPPPPPRSHPHQTLSYPAVLFPYHPATGTLTPPCQAPAMPSFFPLHPHHTGPNLLHQSFHSMASSSNLDSRPTSLTTASSMASSANTIPPAFIHYPFPFHTSKPSSPPPPPPPSLPPTLPPAAKTLSASSWKKDRRSPLLTSSTHHPFTAINAPSTKDRFTDTKEPTKTPSMTTTNIKKGQQHRRQGSYPLEGALASSTADKLHGSSEGKVVSSSSLIPSVVDQVSSACLPRMKKSGSCSTMLWGRSKGGNKQARGGEASRTDALSLPATANLGKRNSAHC